MAQIMILNLTSRQIDLVAMAIRAEIELAHSEGDKATEAEMQTLLDSIKEQFSAPRNS